MYNIKFILIRNNHIHQSKKIAPPLGVAILQLLLIQIIFLYLTHKVYDTFHFLSEVVYDYLA